jgi:hypothetical protein
MRSNASRAKCVTGRLDLLREQFGEIWTPKAVEAELADVPDGAARTRFGTRDQCLAPLWIRRGDGGLVSENVAELVEIPRHQACEIQPLTAEQARKLLESAKGHRLGGVISVATAFGRNVFAIPRHDSSPSGHRGDFTSNTDCDVTATRPDAAIVWSGSSFGTCTMFAGQFQS